MEDSYRSIVRNASAIKETKILARLFILFYIFLLYKVNSFSLHIINIRLLLFQFQEDLLLRALQRIRPDVHRERRQVAKIVRQHRHTLAQLDSILCERLVTGEDPKAVENSTKFLSNVVELKAMVINYCRIAKIF